MKRWYKVVVNGTDLEKEIDLTFHCTAVEIRRIAQLLHGKGTENVQVLVADWTEVDLELRATEDW